MASISPRASEVVQGKVSGNPTVKFVRRSSSGRNVNYSKEDLSSEIGSDEYVNYTVQIPVTPDNQPMDPYIS